MLLQEQFSRKCSCYVCHVILQRALCIFIYFNSLNLQNTDFILRFSSVVGVFYVVFNVCFKYTILLLFTTCSFFWSVTDYVRECEEFSVLLFLVMQCHCIKWPHSLVRFNPQVCFLTYSLWRGCDVPCRSTAVGVWLSVWDTH